MRVRSITIASGSAYSVRDELLTSSLATEEYLIISTHREPEGLGVYCIRSYQIFNPPYAEAAHIDLAFAVGNLRRKRHGIGDLLSPRLI
jgi:hypothetical protein